MNRAGMESQKERSAAVWRGNIVVDTRPEQSILKSVRKLFRLYSDSRSVARGTAQVIVWRHEETSADIIGIGFCTSTRVDQQ